MNNELLKETTDCTITEEVHELADGEITELADGDMESVAGGSRPPC